MHALLEKLLNDGIFFHREGNFAEAAVRYNQILNSDPGNAGVLFLMGDIAVRMGNNGVAIALLSCSVGSRPSVEAFTALGVAYRNENFYDDAEAAWKAGLALSETTELYNNLAANYADHGQPQIALDYANKALALEPNSPNAHWNKSLALLTNGEWQEGWSLHDARFNPSVQSVSTKRNHNCPDWDGTPGMRIAVHGEQGVGDEIMFMSMMPDLLKLCPDAVIEVEPRLMDLAERSFGITAYGTEKAMRAHEKPFDAVVALGSLGKFFRNKSADFPGTPYLKPDPERVAFWRQTFAQQGPGPYIGVAWQGGSKSTRAHHRTISPAELKFCKRGTVISLQYGDAAAQARENLFLYYPESNGRNLDELAAMVAACDMVVTVPQTLVHIAGALGVPCRVLTPLHSSWRYGMGEFMPWYGSVFLHRQKKLCDWAHPLATAKVAVDQLCREYNK